MAKETSPLEKVTETKAKKYAKDRYGVDSMKLGSVYNADWPDRIFWMPCGRPLLIEFKRLGHKPTPAQAHRIEELKSKGYNVHVCDTFEHAKRLIDESYDFTING